MLYALVPSVCNAAAFAIALAFPISPAIHRSIVENIALMKQGREVADALKP